MTHVYSRIQTSVTVNTRVIENLGIKVHIYFYERYSPSATGGNNVTAEMARNSQDSASQRGPLKYC